MRETTGLHALLSSLDGEMRWEVLEAWILEALLWEACWRCSPGERGNRALDQAGLPWEEMSLVARPEIVWHLDGSREDSLQPRCRPFER